MPTCTVAPLTQATQKRLFSPNRLAGTLCLTLSLFLLSQLTSVGIAQCISSSTLTIGVTLSNDDATQSGTNVTTGTNDLQFANRYIGLRFASVYIPKSATITNAYIQFTGNSATSTTAGVSNVGIKGHSIASSNSFTMATGSTDISNRYSTAPTSASVNWTNAATWTNGAQGVNQRTPDLKAIVQEIVNRSDWKPNNPITLLLNASSSATGPSANAYDNPGSTPPQLIITYQATSSVSVLPTISGCYNTTAGSRATVSAEVRWTDAPANDSLIIMLGSQRRAILPGINVISFFDADGYETQVPVEFASSQVFAFEIPANGASGTVTTFFQSNSTCTAVASFTAPAACLPLTCTPGTDLSGTAFNDFNADGVKNSGETSGVSGVVVKAYDCAGTVYTTTTDANGQYKLTIPLANYPVRVEFTNLPAAYTAQGTPNGVDGRTTVQFVTAPDCGVDLGMSDPTDYCQNNPKLFVPCYVSGDPLAGGDAGTMDAFVSVNYTDYSTSTGSNTYTSTANPVHVASAAQVGSLWGTVYNKQTKTIFTSAVLRRHSGLGALGLGGIYAINPATNAVTNFLDVTSLGINVGSSLVGSNGSRGLFGSATAGSYEPVVFTLIGKVGIGGLAMSSNGNQLYFVNLFDKKVYGLDLTTYNSGGASPTTSTSFAIPNGCSAGSNSRPFGIKYYKGKVYVGVVCDGSISDNRSDLRAFVYALDPTTGTWSTIFDFPLTYPKGPSNLFDDIDWGTTSSNWRTWTDTFSQLVQTDGRTLQRSQPILSAIEFDVDNSIVLAFADRTSLQGGTNNFGVDQTDNNLYNTVSGGDVLRAANINGVYILENNAKVAGVTGASPNNNQGPGLGEFYNDNFIQYPILGHAENALGGLALRPGSGNVVVSAIDPLNEVLNAGGFRQLSNTTGAVQSSYVVYANVTTQKSVGLGDIDLGCSTPSFIELGNRVWIDTDNDGIQDPCEPTLSGVTVSLYKSGTVVATTTTNASGEYYFSSKSKLTSGTWSGTGADTTLLPNTAYRIAFGNGQFTNNVLSIGNGQYQLTQAFSSAPTASTLNDSNAQLATIGGNNLPTISVTTGGLGSVNHSIDAGFICMPTLIASVSAVPAICLGATANSTGRINLTGIQNGEKAFLYTSGPAPSYTAVGSQPISSSAVSFTGLTNPATSAGQSYSVIVYNGPVCYTIVTVTLPQAVCGPCALTLTATPGACQSPSNTYTLTGTISLTSATAGLISITDGTATTSVSVTQGQTSATYSLTGLLTGTGNHTVTASLPGCSTVSTTYTAPSSCTASPCGLAMVLTPSLCVAATNSYVLSGTLTATNVPTSGTLTISSTAFTPRSLTLPAAATISGTFSYSGLISTGQNYTVTASYTNSACAPISQTYTAPASCSVAPVCSLSATATAGICATATNTYAATVVVTLTNATAGTLTVSIPGSPPISQTIVANTPSFTAVFANLVSDGLSHTATISLPGCGTTTANFTAPIACSASPVCSISAVATAGVCSTATNTYSVTAIVTIVNPGAGGTVIVSTGGEALIFSTTATSQNIFTAAFTSLISDGALHTVTVSLPGCSTATTTYTAPVSCSASPVCSISAVATPGICTSATNTYSSTIVVTVKNPSSGTLTIADGAQTQTFSTTAGAQNTFTVIFPGLTSNGSSHTVTASLPGCSTTITTYTAPTSCSVAPVCSISAVANPGLCASATNAYSLTTLVTVQNPSAGGTVTVTTGGQTITFSTTALSQNTFNAVFSGLISDGSSHTVTTSLPGCGTVNTAYTAPTSCSVAPICSLTAVTTTGQCTTATNTFSNTVVVTITNATAGTLTVTDGTSSLTFVVPASIGTTTAVATFNGIVSNGASHTVTASLPGCSTTTTTYTAPGSCTQPVGTQLSINKLVNKSKAKLGDVLTYTLVLTNSGIATATNVVVRDSSTTGLRYVTGSATAPVGTTFNQGLPVSNWTVGSITAGQSLSLTFQAIADSSGILYNKATIPGDTAKVCTSIPVQVCTGDTYIFRLTAQDGRSSYKWYKDGVLLTGQTTNILDVTSPGSYSLAADSLLGSCPDFSCCPFIVVEDTLPTFQATALHGTCVGNNAQNNGQIVLSAFKSGYTYQFSLGSDFNENASISGLAQAIPVNGVIATNLVNPGVAQSYTVRVYNSSGCYTDVTTVLNPAVCACSLSAVVTASQCSTATNTYSASVVVTLANATSGTLTVSLPGSTPVSQPIVAGTTSFTAVFTGLPSDGAVHTATVSLPGCSTTTATFTAPASCTGTPVCSLSAVATASQCSTATNTYSASVVVTLTNATSGTLTVSLPGSAQITQPIVAGTTSFTAVFAGLPSDGAVHTATVSLPGCGTATANFTAPVSCTVAPVCSVSAVATASQCSTATNTYSASVIVTLTNTTSGTLTVRLPGATPVSQVVTTNTKSFTAVFAGLPSDGVAHTATISLPGCGTTTATFTAPVSCTAAPVCSLSAVATAGQCSTATNTYSASVMVTLTNTTSGTLTVSIPGATPVSQPIVAGTTSFTAVFAGLPSDGVVHTATISLPGCGTTTATFTAPVSCTAAPVCSLSAVATAGQCSTATNTYSASMVVTLTNAASGTLTVSLPGATPVSRTIVAGTTTFTTLFTGLPSDGAVHTITVSLPGCGTTTATFTAPASCTVAPVCSVSAVAIVGQCSIATNTYSASVVVTLTNTTSGTLTVSLPGSAQISQVVTTNTKSFTAVFAGLPSDGAAHTATISLPGCGNTTATFTAPVSCSASPVCSMSAVVTPGVCQSATNTFTTVAVITLTKPITGVLTVTDGPTSMTFATVAGNSASYTATFANIISNGASHTVTASLPGCSTTISTYVAPGSCTNTLSLSVTDPGTCQPNTNLYSTTGIISLTNASAGTATVTDGVQSTTVAVAAGATSVAYSLTGLISGTGSHTVTVSFAGVITQTTYTAPDSCICATSKCTPIMIRRTRSVR